MSAPPPPRLPGIVATWFGTGRLPWAPGTWGSLAAVPLAGVIVYLFGVWALVLAALAVFLIGWWAAEAYVRATGENDPGAVVVDEVAGQWVTLAALPLDPLAYAVGFLAFRAADIAKLWPAGLAERRLSGGLGIMADDIVAGVQAAFLANLIYHGLLT